VSLFSFFLTSVIVATPPPCEKSQCPVNEEVENAADFAVIEGMTLEQNY
jgi:hypothetical protein